MSKRVCAPILENQLPENETFVLFPFLVKTKDLIHFCIPSGRFKVNKHITANSRPVYFKKPKPDRIVKTEEVNYHELYAGPKRADLGPSTVMHPFIAPLQ